MKPITQFAKHKRNRDGLSYVCKDCMKLYARDYHQRRRLDGSLEPKDPGLKTWEQVDGVLREMAELQVIINTEQALCDKRVAMVRKYSADAIEPHRGHQMHLQRMLEDFMKKNCPKSIVTKRKFRVGSVSFCRGKAKVDLEITLADKMRGKP